MPSEQVSCLSRPSSCFTPRRPPLKTKTSASQPAARANEGRFAYEGLDRVIHERARLSVLTSLVTHPKGLLFNELKQLCTLTDGNLSRHLTVLESEKMVELLKENDRTRPQTICRITTTGRKRYLEYLETLEQVVKDAVRTTKNVPSPATLHNLKPSRI